MGRRGNGFGTLVFKGEGRAWLAKWMYDGKVYTKSTGCSDKGKALKMLEVITRPYRERRAEDVLENLALKLKQAQRSRTKEALAPDMLWEKFKNKLWDGNVAQGTLTTYQKYMSDLSGWLSRNGFNDVSRFKARDAEKYLEELAKRIGAGAFNNMLVFFKRVWKTLGDEYCLQDKTWEGFKKMKGCKSSRRAFKPTELWDMVKSAEADKDMVVLLALGMYTGLRISDCACMRWDSIDFSRMTISVVPIKTKRHMDGPIEIPMHEALAKVLRDAWRDDEEYVSYDNYRLYKTGKLSRKVSELMSRCGIVTTVKVDGKVKLVAGFHSLRHTFISMAINSGMSPMLVQRIVGHSAMSMTEHYFHSNEDKLREGIAALPDFIQGKRPESCPAGLKPSLGTPG